VKKTLTLVLVSFLLVSLTAFAASKNGISTSHNGQVTATAKPSGTFFGGGPIADIGETVIYNNLSNYPLGVYWCCEGWTISGPNSPIGATYADGMPFTPAANGKVTKLVVAVGYVTGTNSVEISLNADANGLPGNVIGKFDVTGLPSFGSCCVTVSKGGGGGVSVTAGTQYWVVVQTDSKSADTWNAWNDNDTNETAQPFAFNNNGVWGATEGILGAFAVVGK